MKFQVIIEAKNIVELRAFITAGREYGLCDCRVINWKQIIEEKED